jgi:hypothetical protein
LICGFACYYSRPIFFWVNQFSSFLCQGFSFLVTPPGLGNKFIGFFAPTHIAGSELGQYLYLRGAEFFFQVMFKSFAILTIVAMLMVKPIFWYSK